MKEYKSSEIKRERSKKWAQEHKERHAVYLKQYALENKEELAVYQREYAEENKEELAEYHKNWYQNHIRSFKEKFYQLNSSAGRRNLIVEITFEQYYELVKANRCQFCSNELPKRGYGVDRLDNVKGYLVGNVAPCCWDCNTRKGALERAGFRYPRTLELLKEILESKHKI